MDCVQGNIAVILEALNKLPEALAMNFEALRIYEKVHGRDHPLAAKTYHK